MKWMFEGCSAIGYARTASDASKFNSSTNKPSTLTFVVLNRLIKSGDFTFIMLFIF